jgi:hypothetical protein
VDPLGKDATAAMDGQQSSIASEIQSDFKQTLDGLTEADIARHIQRITDAAATSAPPTTTTASPTAAAAVAATTTTTTTSDSCPIDGCSAPATAQCSGCGSVRYCGAVHQKAHWSAHKAACKALRNAAAKK